MPTLPRAEPPHDPQHPRHPHAPATAAPVAAPHTARAMARSFGADAHAYDRARPGYPDALIARIAAASPGPDVLDVGCGTGIAARQFQAAGCTVLGVEPDARMAEVARSRGLPVEIAAFEAWEPAGRTFDTVVAAQSWHWVDPHAGARKAAQVLCPGGQLAIFGHVYEPPPAVAEPFAAAFARAVPDSPFAGRAAGTPLGRYQAVYAQVADALRATGRYAEPEQLRYDWQHTYTRDAWLALLPTTGGLTRLEPGRLAPILDAVGAAIDALGGSFTMTYTTLAVTAARAVTA